jgi:hypothetical protein
MRYAIAAGGLWEIQAGMKLQESAATEPSRPCIWHALFCALRRFCRYSRILQHYDVR